ncbi:MAG: SDR family NAD(P)-dependent oxidoreductase [Bacteroidia bacterium]|nr:SDR family NAD(P)-dependent oxidoreductase [Bacteroidia bacterium]
MKKLTAKFDNSTDDLNFQLQFGILENISHSLKVEFTVIKNKMKTNFVTGANSGLGLWTSKCLLDLNYTVIMACRNIEKAQKSIDSFLKFKIKKNYVVKILDLGNFDSIRSFVKGISKHENIWRLNCNAGLSYTETFRNTKNGMEKIFGTNYIGHLLLKNLLLERFKLKRIVFIASSLHDPKNKSPFAPAVFREINELAYPKENPDSTLKKQCEEFYATSKLCMLLFAYKLNRRLKHKNLSYKTFINAINSGLMLTTNLGRTHKFGENLYRSLLDFIFKIIGFSNNPKSSGRSVVKLTNAVTTSGKYYEKGRPVPSPIDSYDRVKAIRLWEGSEAIIGSKFLSK